MKVIGITGGVGAGKSQILSFLEGMYQAKVFQADQAGHQVMEPGTKAFHEILHIFGRDILSEDGRIDRKVLGALVFSDSGKREILNGIIHPAVKQMAREAIAEARKEKQSPFFVIEAALLIEDHYEEICDELWYIYASEAVRRERLKASRGYTDEKISDIFASQLKDGEFRRFCQAVIDNSGPIEKAYEQIRSLLCMEPEFI